jgi:hypothetical protein
MTNVCRCGNGIDPDKFRCAVCVQKDEQLPSPKVKPVAWKCKCGAEIKNIAYEKEQIKCLDCYSKIQNSIDKEEPYGWVITYQRDDGEYIDDYSTKLFLFKDISDRDKMFERIHQKSKVINVKIIPLYPAQALADKQAENELLKEIIEELNGELQLSQPIKVGASVDWIIARRLYKKYLASLPEPTLEKPNPQKEDDDGS